MFQRDKKGLELRAQSPKAVIGLRNYAIYLYVRDKQFKVHICISPGHNPTCLYKMQPVYMLIQLHIVKVM